MNKAPYNLKSDTEVSLPASVNVAIFIYSIANTLNNKKRQPRQQILSYITACWIENLGKRIRQSHLDTSEIQQYKSAIHYTAVEILTMK